MKSSSDFAARLHHYQNTNMDAAAQGAAALQNSEPTSAVSHYTRAIATNPQAVDYYVKRSIAYTRVSPSKPTLALADAEIAVALAHKRGKRELISQAQLRRGIAFFGLERYGDARKCLEWVRKLTPKEKSLDIWEAKIAGKISGLDDGDAKLEVTVKELPEVDTENLGKSQKAEGKEATESQKADTRNGAGSSSAPSKGPENKAEGVQTPASKIRHDWYQSTDTVTITLLAKGVPKEKATVDIQSQSLAMSFPLPTGSDYDFSLDPLFAPIDTTASTYKIMSTKVEFILKKATPGQKWPSLENPTLPPSSISSNPTSTIPSSLLTNPPPPPSTTSTPAYPTSSRSGPKNWDKLASDLGKASTEKGSEYLDDYEGGDETNAFFQHLFKSADPDTRRAMMKSYQESNGTALSTNWEEVSKKKVETSPPEGMEAKKWGE